MSIRIGVVGGTGRLGYGLAVRAARAGYRTAIGSRSKEKASRVADQARCEYGVEIDALSNTETVGVCDLVVLSVPFAGRADLLIELRDAIEGCSDVRPIVLDVCVPFRSVESADEKIALSAAEETQAILGENVTVVSGLHTVSSHVLLPPERPIAADALVCGNNPEANSVVVEVCRRMGIRAFDSGALARSRIAEGLTPIIITLNKQHKTRDIGIRFTI